MEFLQTIVLIINIISAFGIIMLVLMQRGKGADAGATFGSGTAGSLFGSAGSANFLSRSTAVCTVIFFTTSFTLAVLVSPKSQKADLGVMAAIKSSVSASQVSATQLQKNSTIPD